MANSMIKKGKRSVIISIVSECIILLLGLIVPRLYITQYGSEVNGLLNSTAQFLQYLSVFEAGIGTVLVKALFKPLADNDRKEISAVYNAGREYYSRIIPWYIGTLTMVSLIYMTTVKTSIPRYEVFMVVILSGLSNALVWGFVSAKACLIQSDGNYYFISTTRLIITCLSYAGQIVCIHLNCGIVLIKTVAFIITFSQVMIYEIYFRKKYSWIDSEARTSIEVFKDRKYYFLHQFSTLLFSCTDTTLLTFACNLLEVSIYSIYNLVIVAINSVLNMIVSSLSFILGQTYRKDIQQYKIVHDEFKMLYMIVAFTLATTAFILYCPFVELYTQNADINYVDKTLALLFSLICMTNSTRMVDNYLASIAGYAKETLWQVVCELIINLLLSIVLVIRIGIYGVLIGTLAAIVFRYFTAIIFTEKNILNRKIWKGFKYSLVDWCVFGLVYFADKKLYITVKGFISFGIAGLLTTATVFTLYFLANYLVFRNEFHRIKEYTNWRI